MVKDLKVDQLSGVAGVSIPAVGRRPHQPKMPHRNWSNLGQLRSSTVMNRERQFGRTVLRPYRRQVPKLLKRQTDAEAICPGGLVDLSQHTLIVLTGLRMDLLPVDNFVCIDDSQVEVADRLGLPAYLTKMSLCHWSSAA